MQVNAQIEKLQELENSTQHAITQRSAEHGHQVDESHVQTEYLGCERLCGQRSGDELDSPLEAGETRNSLAMPRQQQTLDHVEHEQGLHSMEGNALPQLGTGNEHQTAGMPQKLALRPMRHRYALRCCLIQAGDARDGRAPA